MRRGPLVSFGILALVVLVLIAAGGAVQARPTPASFGFENGNDASAVYAGGEMFYILRLAEAPSQ